MGLCYASSSLARHCPTSCSNIVASQAFSRAISDCRIYPLSRRTPCVALWVSGQKSLWTSAPSLTHAPNWRQLPRIVRPLSTYEAPKDHFQTLETQWQRKLPGEVEPLAERTCTFFDARSPSGTRRAVKSRKIDPPRTAKSPPRDKYLWVAGLIQDSKETGYAIFISRKLVFGFVVVFSSSWLLFNIELSYSASNYSQEKPNTKIAHWLQSFSKVVHPRFPDGNDPLMMDIVMGERPCDWLHSYVSLIPQLTSAFACTTWNSVRNSSLLILAYVPLLKQVMSSRQIVLAYIAGGFLASNIEGAVMYFTNPYASLSAAGLQELLDHIPPSLYPPSSRERLYDCQMYDLRELENEATVMMGAALKEERKELEAKIIEKKKEVEGLRELDLTFIYTRRALGTSCAITCLATIASLALPKSPWRFLVRVHMFDSLSFDVLWLLSPRPNNINHLGHVAGNLAGVSLWFCWLRWSNVRKLPAPRLGTYTGGVILLPWAVQYFRLWRKREPV